MNAPAATKKLIDLDHFFHGGSYSLDEVDYLNGGRSSHLKSWIFQVTMKVKEYDKPEQ
jgi:hypothetical protein